MRTRSRVLVIIGVLAVSIWLIFPLHSALKLGLDLNGGVQLVLRVKTDDPHTTPERRDEVVEQALRTIERRVNELGVSEALVTRYIAADQILVQLPGLSDVARARQIIKSTAQLRLTLVEEGPFATRDAALAAFGRALPPELEILRLHVGASGVNDSAFYAVHRTPALTGNDVRTARQGVDEYNRPAVAFTLRPDAAARFGPFTERHINRRLATVLDDRVMAVATIQNRIDGQGQIAGLTHDEMVEQVITLNTGALPADLEYVEERTVGATLGAASVRAGIAANVLIFERLKEELTRASGPRAAVRAAFTRVSRTILDTHVTSLIAAALLFQFGTIPIQGFATTLALGLVANVFTAVFVSRTLFELALHRRSANRALSLGATQLFGARKIAVTRWVPHALMLSCLIAVAGVVVVAVKGLPLGIDFVGGTLAVVEFERSDVTDEQVRAAVSPLPGEEVVQRYGAPADRQVQVRLPLAATDGDALARTLDDVTEALNAAGLDGFRFQKRELVSAVIGEDLQRRGIFAVCASLAAIGAYTAIRFRPAFAAGALVATVHDVVVTLAVLALAGYDLSLPVTAALLTIVGYSVNDTIVVFDRVRENWRAFPAEPLESVIDLSVNQTMSRTVITAGTTLLAVIALFVFGGEALEAFALAMIVGVVAGTYSTVFIAAGTAILLARVTGWNVKSAA